MEEELVLVTSDLSTYRPDDPGYVHVEWGLESTLHRGIGFPDTTPGLVSNLGPLALNYVLLDGGSGYFRLHAVQPHIASRSEEHTSELQSLMRISYAVFCLKKKISLYHNNTYLH